MVKPVVPPKKISEATAHATFGLLQELMNTLISKGIVSPDEWKDVVKNAAINYKTQPGMSESQRLAANLLAALHLSIGDRESQSKSH